MKHDNKPHNKPRYNLIQNLSYAVKLIWKSTKLMILFAAGMGILPMLIQFTQLYIAPVILEKVELRVTLGELLGTIGLFTLALLLLSSLNTYLEKTQYVVRDRVYHQMISMYVHKSCTTSYANTLETGYENTKTQAQRAVNWDYPMEQLISEAFVLLASIMGFVLYLRALSGLNPLLVIVVGITTVVGFVVSKRTNEWGYRHREEEAEYNHRKKYITNTAMGNEMPKDIRIFGMKEWLNDVWTDAMELSRGYYNRREWHYMIAKIVEFILSVARNGIAYVYLIHYVMDNGLPASEFLLYFSATTGFTAWITGILNSVINLNKYSLSVCRFREYIEWPEPFLFNEGMHIGKEMYDDYEIVLENVSYKYPESDKDTISRMNLTIHPGEKLAIVGLNGAGKTTLIKLICGLLDPTEGRVLLNGQDIREFNRKEYYSLFTAVFQEFSLLQATIAANVAQSEKDIAAGKLEDSVDKAGLMQAISDLPKGLETRLGRLVGDDGVELSGGQTQRLMLARALYKDAPILLLDEPTAALDPIAENDIYQKYSEMTKGKTSVFISHRLASTRFCNRILFLQDGAITEDGTHAELMDVDGNYARLFEVQSRYYREGRMENEQE